jgi:hypothetical protein
LESNFQEREDNAKWVLDASLECVPVEEADQRPSWIRKRSLYAILGAFLRGLKDLLLFLLLLP